MKPMGTAFPASASGIVRKVNLGFGKMAHRLLCRIDVIAVLRGVAARHHVSRGSCDGSLEK